MSAPIVAFFNNKARVGKTSVVYHLAWMYSELGKRVIAADIDPQADLSRAFLSDDRLEELWLQDSHKNTIFGNIQPLIKGNGDILEPHLELISDWLALLVGDLALFEFESELTKQWSNCLAESERDLRVTSAFWRILQRAATAYQANIILIDLAPSLTAINRAALIAADYVVIPLSLDQFALQALPNLGLTFQDWRKQWQERLAKKNSTTDIELPIGRMQPLGYVVLQEVVRLDRPVKNYRSLLANIPEFYRSAILNKPGEEIISIAEDPYCLGIIKDYYSLVQMAREAGKPMFLLKPADGAMGAHFSAMKSAYQDFEKLARAIAQRTFDLAKIVQ